MMKKFGLVLLSVFLTAQVFARDVLQVDAELYFKDQLKMKSPFVVVLGDSSTLAEEGRDGYKVTMTADKHMDNSYTLHNEISNYTAAGFNLLVNESIKLPLNQSGTIEFAHKDAGNVKLVLKIVKQLEADLDENFSQPIR